MQNSSSIADREYTHHDLEHCVEAATLESHDFAWGGGSPRSYWKMKARVAVVVDRWVAVRDGCSTRGGFRSTDGRLFALACPIPEPGATVVLEPVKGLYPFFFWKVVS